MENRLKERLTGAAILVALIVLVVPEMFHGQRTHSPRASTGNEGPPVRSFTIDLNSSGTHPPDQAGAPAGVSTAPAPTVASQPAPVAAPAAPPAQTAPSSGAPEPAAAPAPPRGLTQAHGTHRHAAVEKAWTIQLGLFAQSANAQRLLRSAQSHGFAARVSRYGPKGLYRVAIVGVPDRSDADQLSRRLRAAGLPAAVLGPR